MEIKDPIAIRKSDLAIFEPSHPDDYNEGQALAEILSGKPSWYFRRLVPVKRSWWFGYKLVRNGEIWEPGDPELFNVVEKKDVLRGLSL